MESAPDVCQYKPQLMRCRGCELWHVTTHMSWTCQPECRRSIAYPWRVTLPEAPIQRFFTLTLVPLDPQQAYAAWTHLVQAIRLRWKVGRGMDEARAYHGHKAKRRFEYVRFLEYGTEHGMKHYHVGQHGDYLPQKELSALAKGHGFGEVVDIREVKHRGQVVAYLTDYLSKGGVQKGERKVAPSRGFWPQGRPSVRDILDEVDGEHRHEWRHQGDATRDEIEVYAQLRRHGGWKGRDRHGEEERAPAGGAGQALG